MLFQSSRPARGATVVVSQFARCYDISILAPRTGRDSYLFNVVSSNVLFQSSRPTRGATSLADVIPIPYHISIRAPRAGRDLSSPLRFGSAPYFNPRAPCGARRYTTAPATIKKRFQSSRPVRGATLSHACRVLCCNFNPRAPCGARLVADTSSAAASNFNPRAPCGARLGCLGQVCGVCLISILAPRAGRDGAFPSPAQ